VSVRAASKARTVEVEVMKRTVYLCFSDVVIGGSKAFCICWVRGGLHIHICTTWEWRPRSLAATRDVSE
jgi:hypothetical protein